MAEEQITNTTTENLLNTTETPTTNNDFTSMLDASFKENPSLTKFNGDVNKLAKSYLSLESMLGQGRVVVPKDEADAEAWGMYDKAFGVPEKDEGYKLNAPDGMELSEFKKIMKENHISQTVAQKLLDAHLGEFDRIKDDALKNQENLRQNAEAELKKEWGLKYSENLKNANLTLKKLSNNEDDYKYFVDTIGNDTRFIRLLNNIGSKMSEGSLGGFEGQVSGFTKTPSEAKQELEKILSDPNDAYFTGVRNQRGNPQWCREHNQNFVSEEERRARVGYVNSLVQMAG